MPTGKLEREFLNLLAAGGGERPAHRFLKAHDFLILQSFNTAWNWHCIVPEFRFGSDFRSDFLILSAHSGCWNAIFIELESPQARLYRRDGTPTKTLLVARRQILQWHEWADRNKPYLRDQLARLLSKRRAHPQCSVVGRYSSGADEIRDGRTYLDITFHIVIGRSSALSHEEREARDLDNQFMGGQPVATYDRLLHFCRQNDTGAA